MRGRWGLQYSLKPRQAMSAYSFYVQENYRKCRRALRNRNPHVVIREVAGDWLSIGEAEKEKYKQMAEDDKIRAKEENIRYYEWIDAGKIEAPPKRPPITKEPGYPPKPKSAYLFFWIANHAKVRLKNPSLNRSMLTQEMVREWRSLEDEEKADYVDKAVAERNRFFAAKKQFFKERKAVRRLKRINEQRERVYRVFNTAIGSKIIAVD